MAYALGLPDALRRRGLTVEVVPGWETRSAGTFNPKGAVCHWTAGPAGSKTRPSLNVVTNGRPDLSGPLCNVYGDRDGVAVVVAAGRANHAGAGGWKGLVGNSAVFGTEMEAAGPADFTDAQRWAYPRINSAYCDLGKFGANMVCGHSEWATPIGRKTDVNNYPMSTMRAQIAALLANPNVTKGFLMALSDAEQTELLNGIRDLKFQMRGPNDKGWDVNDASGRKLSTLDIIRDIQHEVRAPFNGQTMVGRLMVLEQQNAGLQAAVSNLAAAVAQGGGASAAELKQVIHDAMADTVKVQVSVDGSAA